MKSIPKPRTRIFPLLLLLTLLCDKSAAGDPSYLLDQDIPYGHDDDRQVLDVIRRTTATADPVLFYVHGGAWSSGGKERAIASGLAVSMLRRGYVLVSANYRFTPPYAFPQNAEDVAAAIAWVLANIGDYGGNPSQLFLLGHSAGAHLASLVAVHDAYLARHGLGVNSIKGVIALDTQAYDLIDLAHQQGGQFGLFSVFRQAFSNDPRIWHRASPALQVSPGAGLPAFAICYTGGATGRTLYERRRQADRFASRLRLHGADAYVLSAIEKTHEQIMSEFGREDDPLTSQALSAIGAP